MIIFGEITCGSKLPLNTFLFFFPFKLTFLFLSDVLSSVQEKKKRLSGTYFTKTKHMGFITGNYYKWIFIHEYMPKLIFITLKNALKT